MPSQQSGLNQKGQGLFQGSSIVQKLMEKHLKNGTARIIHFLGGIENVICFKWLNRLMYFYFYLLYLKEM